MYINTPHPIPYQGSKRKLANAILHYFPLKFKTLFEPFAGSAAITIAASIKGYGEYYHINDLNKPLMDLWKAIIETPENIAEQYQTLWINQGDNLRTFYNKVRSDFNRTGRPDLFLYLLARCVKGAVRYNSLGEFNQSPDNRRRGMQPTNMRKQILGASSALRGKTTISSLDYKDICELATPHDLIYMDPPYQGVCGNKDTRYLQNIQQSEFIEILQRLNTKKIRYLVSYDGRTGTKVFGTALPKELNLTLIELYAGRSSQATLLGKKEITVESLYLSPELVNELNHFPNKFHYVKPKQFCLFGDSNV